MALMKLSKKLIASAILTSLSTITMANCVLDSFSSGWTGSVTFHCDEPTDLYDNPVSFDVDHAVKVSSIWGIDGKTQLTQDDSTVSVSVKKCWPDEPYTLPANQSVTMQFSPSSNEFNISNFHVGPVTPVSQAHISVELPEKPGFIQEGHLADIIIYKDGNKLTEINSQPWNTKLDVKVPLNSDQDTAKITISVPSLDEATGSADPANFVLSNGQTQSVQIKYKQLPVETGTLKITSTVQGSTPEIHPHYVITTMDNVVVKEGDLDWKANFIDGLRSSAEGVHYKFNVASFIEGDYEYMPEGKEQLTRNITIKTDKTTPAKITYQLEKILPEKVSITVSGLPKGAKAALNLKDEKGASIAPITLDHNGSYPVQNIPRNNLNWHADATNIITEKNRYLSSVSPSNFIANKDGINLDVSYKKESSHYMVGYLNQYYGPWNQKVTISDAAQAGYNVIVIAFASGLSDATPVTTGARPNIQFYGDMFLAYTSYNTFDQTSLQKMLDDIQLAKDKYGLKKILVSVGGETGGISLDNKNLDNMAENIRYFLNYYHLDGIDFDLEGAVNPTLLKELIAKIKQKPLASGQMATLTAAPQLNQTNKEDKYSVSLVTTAMNQDYKEAVESGVFDMLFLQDYNTGKESNRIEYKSDYCNGEDDDGRLYCSEEMPGYIDASFYYLTQQTTSKQQLLNIPAQTLLVMGEPALQAAGGLATVFSQWQPAPGQTVYSEMADIYGSLSSQPQYGGAMVWSINHDFNNDCQFAKSIAPSVTGVSPSYCQASGV